MGLRKFLHDFFGYIGDRRELHAMLCVIEAHVEECPEEWVYTAYSKDDRRVNFVSKGPYYGLFNQQKNILILVPNSNWSAGVFIGTNKVGIYTDLDLSSAWYRRFGVLCAWHETYRNNVAYKKHVKNLYEIVNRFRKVTQLEAMMEPTGFVVAKIKADETFEPIVYRKKLYG